MNLWDLNGNVLQHWLVKKMPSVRKKNGKEFVMGFSIETIVNVAKKPLEPENIIPVCCSSRKIRVNLNVNKQYNNISKRLGLQTLKLIIHKTTVTLQKRSHLEKRYFDSLHVL